MELETASLTNLPDEGETRRLFDDLMRNFEEFKQVNDERLDEIEKRNSADVLLEEKVERINTHLSDLNVALQRPPLESEAQNVGAETRAAFVDYVRTGNDQELRKTEAKTFRKNPTSDGGFLVPDVIYADLDSQIRAQSAMRQLANVVVMGAGDTLQHVRLSETLGASWASETAARTETADGDFRRASIDLDEVYFNLTATQQFLDDAAIDVEAWIISSMAQAFAQTEGAAFISGTGSGQPMGLMRNTSSTTYSRSSNAIYARKSGASGKLPTGSAGADVLIDLAFGLEAPYSSNASWLMNSASQAEVRKIKDSDGRYLWSPSLEHASMATILGFPVYEDANMQNFAASTKPICFGDFKSAYTIAERNTTHFTRDPYSSKPNIVFYASRRVGGGVVNPQAVRFIQLSA